MLTKDDLLAKAQNVEPKTQIYKLNHLAEVIDVLRNEKRFTYKDILAFLEENGIKVSKGALYNFFRRQKALEARIPEPVKE